jgi:hypothetical protein
MRSHFRIRSRGASSARDGKRQTEYKRKPQAALQMAAVARKDLLNISILE